MSMPTPRIMGFTIYDLRLTRKQTRLDKVELRFSFKLGTMKINSTAFACTCLLFLCSCATEKPIRPRQPADVTMNKEAGQGGLLIVTLRLASGEKLPFMVDTGASGTGFDKSLERKLGKRLGNGTAWHFGDKQEGGAYVAPRLYLGNAPLMMTGTNVFTYDLRPFSSTAGRPILGVLGMDVLAHYCIQLDFQAGMMRFLDDTHSSHKDWGRPFALTDIGDGRFSVGENLAGAKDSGSVIDSGCNYDGWLSQQLFRQWTNQAGLPAGGEVRSPMGVLGGETYCDIILRGFGAETISVGDSHIVFNGIGLRFLARHLVTFDFPKRTMYLKRTGRNPQTASSDFRRRQSAGRAGTASACAWCPRWRGQRAQSKFPPWHRRGFGEDFAGGAGHETLAPEFNAFAREFFVADAIGHGDVAAVGDGVAALDGFPRVVLAFAVFFFSPGCQPMAVG
jgi:hypothetical protein